jgi:hypothetical protein
MADEELQLVFRRDDGHDVFPVVVESEGVSPHTGVTLRTLLTEITVTATRARAIATLLETPELVDEDDGTAWRGRIRVQTYGEAQGFHHLQIEWEQVEHLNVDTVEFEGLALHPTKYEEHAEEFGIAISMLAELTPAETATLRDVQRLDGDQPSTYFSVVRHGLSDKPRDMRFGRVLWQPLANGDVKHEITLVDKGLDEGPISPFATIGEPQTGHLLDVVEQLAAERNALLDALVAAGVLDDQAAENIRRAGAGAAGRDRYQFFKVRDLARWEIPSD